MIENLGDRQQELLKLLLKNHEGLSIDALSSLMRITRTAVRQHLSALERSDLVEAGEVRATGGRPLQVFKLSARGHDAFPKQYSWFSELLIESILKERGSDGLREWMKKLGEQISTAFAEKLNNMPLDDRLREISKILNSLSYEAQVAQPDPRDGAPALEAVNCVYHALAQKHPEICAMDLALLEKLSGSKVIHEKCIAQGAGVCRFKFNLGKKTP